MWIEIGLDDAQVRLNQAFVILDVPYSATGAFRRFDRSSATEVEVLDARGWPFLAMRGGYDIDSPDGRGLISATHDAIMLDIRPMLPGSDKTMAPLLPLGIIWRGFILDSLIFAGAWFGILFIPGAIRRTVRRRRGLCIACGYDLRGANHEQCPECGAPRPAIFTS